MSLKIEFVERASVKDAKIAPLCREYGITRETGHKWLRRFREEGYDGLDERSRRPKGSPLASAEELVAAILEARTAHPRWGPKKIAVLLRRSWGARTPSVRTIARVLKRFGQIRERRRRFEPSIVERAPEVAANAPNDVWTVDFKGWWRSLDGERCEPLTVRDAYSRYVLESRLLSATSIAEVRPVFEKLFRVYGVPKAIQCDNGVPFVVVNARAGLTKLSAWWVSLGIRIVRSRPGCPQDNGGHERMHRDMSADLQVTPAASREAQQRACDRWRKEFNHVRPHEAIDGRVPADLFAPSDSKPRVRMPIYPDTWLVRAVGPSGCIKYGNQDYPVSRALRKYRIGLQPLDGIRWRMWFYDIDLGELEMVRDDDILSAARRDRASRTRNAWGGAHLGDVPRGKPAARHPSSKEMKSLQSARINAK